MPDDTLLVGQSDGRRTHLLSREVAGRFLVFFLPTAGVVGLLMGIVYGLERANERTIHRRDGEHLVRLASEIITRELRSLESDLLYLSDRASLREFLSGDRSRRAELEADYVLFSRRKGLYDQVRYIDESGMERIRVNFDGGAPAVVPEGELQSKTTRYYFLYAMALERGQVFVSPLDLNVEHGRIEEPYKPVIRFAAPAFDAAGRKRGIVVINYLAEKLLGKLVEISANTSARLMLLNGDGYFLLGRTRDEEWAFMFGRDCTFGKAFPDAWPIIRQWSSGQWLGAGGLCTFRTIAWPAPGQSRGAQVAAINATTDLDTPVIGNTLKVVQYVPPALLHTRSQQLVRRVLWLYVLILVILAACLWFLAFTVAIQRQHKRQLAQSEARLRTLSARLLTAQEEERRSIARDLHDELGQVATRLSLDLQRAAQTHGDKHEQLIGHAVQDAECLLEAIHVLAASVRPTLLDDLGLKDAIQSYLADYERHTGIAPTTELRFERHDVPSAACENIYRILQEALHNVAKHAQTRDVSVEVQVLADRLHLTVRDGGVGFDPESRTGDRLGILGMRERAELLGGEFFLESEPGVGTEIQVRLPLAPAE